MKKVIVLCIAGLSAIFLASFGKKQQGDEPQYIPASDQRTGDSAAGYQYLITGDFLKSGIPYDFFIKADKGTPANYLNRTGKNATVDYMYNVVTNADSVDIVIPTCLTCHAQLFEGKLYVGLGNSFSDFTKAKDQAKMISFLRVWQTSAPANYRAIRSFMTSLSAINPHLETEVPGVNAADRLAALLVAHRDPQTLVWSDKPMLEIPEGVIPTDVPAWWLLNKKNAMFYNGFGRGDFGKFLMASNLLTVKDSSEAREVNAHFGDVLAYIRSIQPPPYPKEIDHRLAEKGKVIFTENCSGCHGTYGQDGKYPNLLIPESIVGTDSVLYKSNQQDTQFVDWFNRSWFSNPPNPAKLVPFTGYIAPPLDGIWITAPYLHNGSVPTIEAVLNSKLRPQYWSRNFTAPVYDYEHVGWQYETREKPEGRKVYNTTLAGYGNYGHYFGDHLSEKERHAVIEYLKTI